MHADYASRKIMSNKIANLMVIRYVILRNVYGTIARCSSMSSEGNLFSDSPSFRNVAGIHLEAVSQRT